MNNERMDSKNKHPFAITCRKCGSNDVTVTAFEHWDLELKCNNCGKYVSCGRYNTLTSDYSVD